MSSHQMKEISERFLRCVHRIADDQDIPIIVFEEGELEADVAAESLAGIVADEGMRFIGEAQEQVRTFRIERRRNANGQTHPWIVETTAMVNPYSG